MEGETWIEHRDDDGYGWRASRVDIGCYSIVAVEIDHPNWKQYLDHMVWIESPHMGWTVFPIGTIYEEQRDLQEFLKVHPYFRNLFEEEED